MAIEDVNLYYSIDHRGYRVSVRFDGRVEYSLMFSDDLDVTGFVAALRQMASGIEEKESARNGGWTPVKKG